MEPCSLGNIEGWSGGSRKRGDAGLVLSRVHTDSRTLRPGDCFWALSGANFDGNDFVEEAFRRGAKAAVVSRSMEHLSLPAGAGLVEVADTLAALQRFARQYRRTLPAKIVAVSGSSGKTTTKELILHVLRRRFSALGNAGNRNNQIGLPLALLDFSPKIDFGVLEMGTNHPGEIARLAAIAAPDIGVLTNIGQAHVGFFGSEEAIAEEKGALLAALPPEGGAVLSDEDGWIRRISGRSRAPVLWVGSGPEAAWRARQIEMKEEGVHFLLQGDSGELPVQLRTASRAVITDALLAAGVGKLAGLSAEEIVRALEEAVYPAHRMEVHRFSEGWVIDDSYNANPDSALAALRALAEFPKGDRRGAVLGSMGELGSQSPALHERLGRSAGALPLAFLIVVGPEAVWLARGASEGGLPAEKIHPCANAEEAIRELRALRQAGDVILVKGSRFLGLERLVHALLSADGGGKGPE
ncbi:UDP-N-acetylmuramoyl-tripeptide--D-alanyl-D-alanine ligase [Methylacidimicrobium tartarophylax]|uniref:UDP-N-acetylmuramoyl-tripeptide--D-alanyl-D-alanine ligase n=1 Tax=Methylacidimicrobium tartarophylax TaxID=1041768 RepID=A0A5E6MA13_9BACT|nr:UDP-N-acetylmuramoyl-tripeptide--D-alanyl-D-alanine ligase [Methylacidimicrobium tartarophylax]VVM04593.1 UDP-N-acetylmuramoyl-tripeptide--D-alanyl-D-alanine ligase [Methylacidimicrobium tartarophylax]